MKPRIFKYRYGPDIEGIRLTEKKDIKQALSMINLEEYALDGAKIAIERPVDDSFPPQWVFMSIYMIDHGELTEEEYKSLIKHFCYEAQNTRNSAR